MTTARPLAGLIIGVKMQLEAGGGLISTRGKLGKELGIVGCAFPGQMIHYSHANANANA